MSEMKFGAHADSPPRNTLTGLRFDGIVRLNERTPDGRLIQSGGFSIRDLPLSFKTMFADGPGGHIGSVITGLVDEVTIEDNGLVWGMGWLMDSDPGRDAGRLVQAGALRGNSIDLAAEEMRIEIDWDAMKILRDFTKSKMAATTLVSTPAMEGLTISLEDPDFDFGATDGDSALVAASVSDFAGMDHAYAFSVASPVVVHERDGEQVTEPVAPAPSAEWFGEQDWMEALTPIRIEEPDANGFRHVWGFLFDWDTPHAGWAEQGIIVRAPKSHTDYAYFANGETLTDDGLFTATGRLVLGCPHADERMGWQDAMGWYGDKGRSWAAVAIGENRIGGWVNGYVLPGTPPEDITLARALGTSGDWRRIGGNLELIAGVTVNAEGFPKPRPKAYSAGGVQLSLTGAGYIEPRWLEQHAAGRFMPTELYEDMATATSYIQRQEMAEIEKDLLVGQQAEMREIEEALG